MARHVDGNCLSVWGYSETFDHMSIALDNATSNVQK